MAAALLAAVADQARAEMAANGITTNGITGNDVADKARATNGASDGKEARAVEPRLGVAIVRNVTLPQ
ncbi:MAG: hypothetical protein HY246_16070 [Proteobacteria bacterium]|nr:hypothetical protein [Pseudomonadota bacterium]